MSLVEVHEVHKHYLQGTTVVRALDGITLQIDPAEFIAVVGRSGSGKTTLLDLIGLLLRPTGGTVRITGTDANALSERGRAWLRARSIGFVFQEYNLLPQLSALENVLLPTRYVEARGSQDARARQLLAEVGLEERLRHRPGQLSGGEQQRVALARALVNRPQIILADEPTGALDSETGAQLVGLLRTAQRVHGVTVVLITHDHSLASSTDRVIRLSDGRVVDDRRASAAHASHSREDPRERVAP